MQAGMTRSHRDPPSSSKRPISYDQDLTSIEATFSVDDLVADSSSDNYGHLFGGFNTSRSSTPSLPPGLPIPSHFQPIGDDSQPRSSSLMTATSVPFTPKRNVSNNPRPATPLAGASVSDGPQSSKTPTPQAIQKHDTQALARSSGLSEAIASQSEDFPALGSTKTKAPATPTPSKVKPTSTATSRKQSAITPAAVQTPSKSDKHPGILNISVPKVPAKTDAPANEPSTSAFPPLPPSTPSASSIQSPMSTKAPKTLRIASSMKPETPAAGSATPSSVTSAFPQFPPSRQPSLASMSRHERPGTPTSEMISDNASVTSTSMSRANSPPPSRVGSAPVRATTKSKHKKQRKEVKRELEKSVLEAAAAKLEPKVEEVAPIMGKKRKQKKERNINSAAGGSTPAASRPVSPSPADVTPVPEETQVEKTRGKQSSPVEPETIKIKDTKGKGKAKNQQQAPIPTPPSPTIASVPDSPPPTTKPIPTPSSTLHQLASTGAIPDPAHLSLLKPLTTPKFQLDAELQSLGQKLTITPEDRTALLAGHAVHKSAPGPSRIMLTPNGDYVRNLSPEEEERYLQLQSHLAESAGPAAFVSGKHNSSNGFTLIGGRAVPNGPPSFFPQPAGTIPPLDPVSKIQRDEALSYINQYVLPSLSTNKQLENALNANALDNFPSWGAGDESGVLANGIDGMSAHFAVDGAGGNVNGGIGGGSGRPLGNVSLLGCREAESAMVAARKEAEGIEKRLSALVKKNKRLLLGSGH